MNIKPEDLSMQSFQKENGENLINNQILNNVNNNINNNTVNNDQQLLDLAIKQSKEQENLEIELDKEEELIQLALYNSIIEFNNINNEKVKAKENKNKIDIKEEKDEEEEKFDEDFGICPIKLEYMKHPMLTPSGNYYEKSAIFDWIKKNQTDPMTREKLTKDMLIEDKDYAEKIKEYKKKFRKEIRKLKK